MHKRLHGVLPSNNLLSFPERLTAAVASTILSSPAQSSHPRRRAPILRVSVPNYTVGDWQGPAAKVSAGTEAFEAYQAMVRGNYSLVLTGAPTVSVVGGWAQGGGHSTLSSMYGLGADQLLSINVVTADGRFLTADVNQNRELF